MPSVMTISGTSARKPRRSRRKRPAGDEPRVGDCKEVRNPRTKRTQTLCFLGKTKRRPSGWTFVKNR